jgi:4-amino-4-deoxy-L-arabinose transferase-like glycosyltransferase
LYLANISVNGLGNPYYAAAVKSGSVNWKAFLFGSLDPGSFITVDKPPAAFWAQEISVRIFGYSSWSLLVPEALAGIVAVAVVYHLARRVVIGRTGPALSGFAVGSPTAGELVGVLAGLALAVTPVAAVMFRFNDPDALLTLMLTLAAWAGWAAIERGSVRHLVLAGALVGVAFDAKMLEAAIVVPGLALAWLIAAPLSWKRRVLGWLWSGLALLVSAGWWVAVVELWPTADRPYIASTTNNNLLSLIFGYNGLARLFGNHGGGFGGGGRGAGAGPTSARTAPPFGTTGHAFGGAGFSHGGGFGGFGGGAGWGRLFSASLGSQISWLLPLAGAGLVVGLVSAGRKPRSDARRAGYILFGGWALTAFVVFSLASGTFHSYYTVAMAPPVALLASVGAANLWALGRRHRSLAWALPVAVAGSALWAAALLHRDPSYHPWLALAIAGGGVLAALGLLGALLLSAPAGPPRGPDDQSDGHPLAGLGRDRRGTVLGRPLMSGASLASIVALLAGPFAWTVSSLTHAASGTNPTPGPAAAGAGAFASGGARGGFPNATRGGASAGFGGGFAGTSTSGPTAGDKAFVAWLEAQRDGSEYLVAVDGSMSADDLIIASGLPVMDMGGFSGTDPVPTLAQFEHLVAQGKVRYVLVGGGGFGGGGFAGGGGRSGAAVTSVDQWVETNGTVVPTSQWGGGVAGTLYEVTAASAAKALGVK